LGPIFKKSLSKAINDDKYSLLFGHLKDFQRKAAVLQDICSRYDHVLFIDDDARNITAAKKLALSNLSVITAQ
jgi:thiamine monophosphate synthase